MGRARSTLRKDYKHIQLVGPRIRKKRTTSNFKHRRNVGIGMDVTEVGLERWTGFISFRTVAIRGLFYSGNKPSVSI
jgi:hypothetical protein